MLKADLEKEIIRLKDVINGKQGTILEQERIIRDLESSIVDIEKNSDKTSDENLLLRKKLKNTAMIVNVFLQIKYPIKQKVNRDGYSDNKRKQNDNTRFLEELLQTIKIEEPTTCGRSSWNQ